MTERKIIAVVGATGAQGGGLVRAVLEDPAGGFAARALTRDPESEAARRLAEAGAPEVYRGFDFPGADDLGNMFQYERDFEEEFCGARDVERTRQLDPRLQSYEEWLAANASRIPLGGG